MVTPQTLLALLTFVMNALDQSLEAGKCLVWRHTFFMVTCRLQDAPSMSTAAYEARGGRTYSSRRATR
jgi:hypothetical protein